MSVRFGIAVAVVLTVTGLASEPAPADVGVSEIDVTVQTGSCDWYCGDDKYRSYSTCEAACGEPCERLCW